MPSDNNQTSSLPRAISTRYANPSKEWRGNEARILYYIKIPYMSTIEMIHQASLRNSLEDFKNIPRKRKRQLQKNDQNAHILVTLTT